MVAGLLLLAPIGSARGGEANYQPYIVGERAPGMGGAICATADGMDAAFYNPAGLARVQQNSISVNGTFYGLQHYETESSLFPGEELGVDSFVTIPAGISAVRRLGTDLVGSFSVFVPSQSSAKEIRAFPENQHFYNFSDDEQTLWLGPSLGYQASDRLSLGASVFAVYQSASHFNNLFWGDYAYSYALDYKYSTLGLVAAAGSQYRLTDRWNLGLTVLSPSLSLAGSGKWQESAVRSDEDVQGKGSIYMDDLDAENGLPAQIKFGLAWQKPKSIGFGVDVTHHFSRNYDLLSNGEDSLERRRESVTDVQAGGEYYVKGRYPVRAGAFTSFSSAPDVDPQNSLALPQVDLYGLTASAGMGSEHLVINMGINYIFGSGDARGTSLASPDTLQGVVVSTKERAIYLFASTAYLF